MSKNTKEQEIPYSYLVDNIKIFLIFWWFLITLLHSSWLKQIRLCVLCGMELPYFICRLHIYFRLSVQEASGCDEEC